MLPSRSNLYLAAKCNPAILSCSQIRQFLISRVIDSKFVYTTLEKKMCVQKGVFNCVSKVGALAKCGQALLVISFMFA